MTETVAAADVKPVLAAELKGFVLPAGTFPRIKLSGDQLTIEIVSTPAWEVIVRYPDGYQRHHQASSVLQLLEKIDGQLRKRYNLEGYSVLRTPQSISTGETLVIGEIKYA